MLRLFVRHNPTGTVHEYGTDPHDALLLMEDGSLHYENLQSCTGTQFPEEGYSFCREDGTIPQTDEVYGGEPYIDIVGCHREEKRRKENEETMNKCANCIHTEVCGLWREKELQDASSFQLSGCDYFKDRALIVELPCRIGDDIWWIDEETNSVQRHKSGVAGFVVKSDGIYVMDECGSIDKVGTKWCYLTKEDAEKALLDKSEK